MIYLINEAINKIQLVVGVATLWRDDGGVINYPFDVDSNKEGRTRNFLMSEEDNKTAKND